MEKATSIIKLNEIDKYVNNLGGIVFRCKFDEEMTMEYIGEGVMDLSRYPSKDFQLNRVRSFTSIIHVHDRDRIKKCIERSLNIKSSFTVEFRIVSKHGEIKWIWGRGKGVLAEDDTIAIEGFFFNIVERHKTDEELNNSLEQSYQLAQHIEEIREKERQAISRELHDDIGQALTAVKIDLATMKQNVTDMAIILKINKTSTLVSETIKTVQRITSQLRPQIIDDLGLETAIEWYTKEFEQRNRIRISRDIDADITITPKASLIIFRIMQEALTNIAKYSGANSVTISLCKNGDNIEFSISDNGIGIALEKLLSKKSFGIINMKERAALLGGTLNIYRKDNRFTVIDLIYPYNNNETNENSNL